MTPFPRDYSASPSARFDAVEDIKAFVGPARWRTLQLIMPQCRDTPTFRLYCTLIGVEGFAVEAWYDLYFGQGSYAASVALHTAPT